MVVGSRIPSVIVRIGCDVPGAYTVTEPVSSPCRFKAYSRLCFVIGSPDGGTGPLTRYKLHNGNGAAVGKVQLCAVSCSPPTFSIAGSELALSCGFDEGNSLNYYTYPKGGKPIKDLVPGQSGSVAISAS